NGRPRLVRAGEPLERLSPQVRESALNAAIPAIPIDVIRDFLLSPRVVTPEQIRHAPYILDFVDQHLVAASGNRIYVKNLTAKGMDRYSVVRAGGAYKDPDSGEILGYEATPVGTAEVQEFGNPGTANLIATSREARIGDRLIAAEDQDYEAYFYPRAPKTDVHGSILSVFDGVTQIGQYEVVAISRGSRDGLKPGHVLTIMQAGRSARDPYTGAMVKLPEEQAGTVMVFKTTPRISYALVMDETRAVHVFDHVVTPRPSTALH
ncbi:MAG: LysM peptidoglycan-binding domain-containing protein, partial [Stenotrophobium sp.]